MANASNAGQVYAIDRLYIALCFEDLSDLQIPELFIAACGDVGYVHTTPTLNQWDLTLLSHGS